MRVITYAVILVLSSATFVHAQISPQNVTVETMAEPGTNWFISSSREGGYIFDASTGDMHGLISLSNHTPAVQPHPGRREIYAAESYYARGVHGERTDVLTIYDYENLSPVAEVEIPKKIAVLPFREYIALMSDGKHVGLFNMTPAQSVSIVNVEDRSFAVELSTPGCALIMPVSDNGFLMICGDGTLQLIRLDANGGEASRARSGKFFDVQVDPVFDRPLKTAAGWLLLTHEGEAFDVSVTANNINVSDAWNIVTRQDAEDDWRPGGFQLASVHQKLGLLYVAMHQGEPYTHHDGGSEIWVFDIGSKRRIGRIEFEVPVLSVLVTQEVEPLLIVGDDENETHVYDALEFTYQRSIEAPGTRVLEDF